MGKSLRKRKKATTGVIPVLQKQIDAANRLHDRIGEFLITAGALRNLGKSTPGWNREASLIKCIAVNAIYNTQVFDIKGMAKHVSKILGAPGLNLSNENQLIERIANVDSGRRHISFASKLCHLFVDERRFPIYDTVARKMLRYHLRKEYCNDHLHPYSAFLKNLRRLREQSDIEATTRELDHYLWIRGLYLKYAKSRRSRINAQLRGMFKNPKSRRDLAILLLQR